MTNHEHMTDPVTWVYSIEKLLSLPDTDPFWKARPPEPRKALRAHLRAVCDEIASVLTDHAAFQIFATVHASRLTNKDHPMFEQDTQVVNSGVPVDDVQIQLQKWVSRKILPSKPKG